MSLDTVCREEASYATKLLGATSGRDRKALAAREFLLCENHSQLVSQVDRELIEEGWATVFAEQPRFLA